MIDPEQLDVVLTDVDERHRRVRCHVHGAKVRAGVRAADFMDGRGMIHDGSGGPVGQRPGFLVRDNEADDQAREDAREYAATVSERWRQGPGQRSSPARSKPQTFANAEAARAAAYAEYSSSIQERWRK